MTMPTRLQIPQGATNDEPHLAVIQAACEQRHNCFFKINSVYRESGKPIYASQSFVDDLSRLMLNEQNDPVSSHHSQPPTPPSSKDGRGTLLGGSHTHFVCLMDLPIATNNSHPLFIAPELNLRPGTPHQTSEVILFHTSPLSQESIHTHEVDRRATARLYEYVQQIFVKKNAWAKSGGKPHADSHMKREHDQFGSLAPLLPTIKSSLVEGSLVVLLTWLFSLIHNILMTRRPRLHHQWARQT